MAGGGQIVWGRGCRKRQGGGAKKGGGRGVGEGGWGKGVGRVVGKGVGRGFNRSFEQNRYRYIDFGYRNAHYETKSAEIAFFGGFPSFWQGIPVE